MLLHTDGAITYKMKIDGMLHDHVVHQKKRLMKNGRPVKVHGKTVWKKPCYAMKFTHALPNGRKIVRKGGTQIIDRFWSHLRTFMRNRSTSVGSAAIKARIRSAQWDYWHRDADAWLATGEMLDRLRSEPKRAV